MTYLYLIISTAQTSCELLLQFTADNKDSTRLKLPSQINPSFRWKVCSHISLQCRSECDSQRHKGMNPSWCGNTRSMDSWFFSTPVVPKACILCVEIPWCRSWAFLWCERIGENERLWLQTYRGLYISRKSVLLPNADLRSTLPILYERCLLFLYELQSTLLLLKFVIHVDDILLAGKFTIMLSSTCLLQFL